MKHYATLLGLIIFTSIFSIESLAEQSDSNKVDQEVITFGIVPQQAASKLATSWAPILKYLSSKSGVKLVFKTAPDIPTFESRVMNGEYDIAYMNPYHYSVYSIKPGYKAFAKQKNKLIRGILVARKDSSIVSLEDLQHKTLAFPSPAAFAASMLPRAYLSNEGVKFKVKYVGSHDSVYKSVAKGFFVAGGGIERTLNSLDSQIRQELEIIWKSEGFTPHAFAYHPGMNVNRIEKIKKAMIDMSSDSKAKMLLERIKFEGIVSAEDSDWDDVRFLDIAEVDWLLRKSGK